MFIDASAIVAFLSQEHNYQKLDKMLSGHSQLFILTPVKREAVEALAKRNWKNEPNNTVAAAYNDAFDAVDNLLCFICAKEISVEGKVQVASSMRWGSIAVWWAIMGL